MGKEYRMDEVFSSIVGLGEMSGTPATFFKFHGCNLQCQGCDEWGRFKHTILRDEDLVNMARMIGNEWVVLTGGEPTLQVNDGLVDLLHRYGHKVMLETNGILAPPDRADYIAVSPRTAEISEWYSMHRVEELRYHVSDGDPPPTPHCEADRLFLCPNYNRGGRNPKNIAYAVELCKARTKDGWRISAPISRCLGMRF